MLVDPFAHEALRKQIQSQKDHAWDLERDIPWSQGIDTSRFFLPLDEDSIVFPEASAEQRLALSQYMGLVINATIAEMEAVIHKLKDSAWRQLLKQYPVNPEMWELGELFFDEEGKHSMLFSRYNQLFCKSLGIDEEQFDRLMPKAFGSLFQRAIIANSHMGGHAFWWVVASVEEVSIEIYRPIYKHRLAVDPLYHTLHRKHLEDEARHRNYAFLMLNLIQEQHSSLGRFFHKKTDLLLAQTLSTGWVISELSKIFEVKQFADNHPYFKVLASCLPLMRQVKPVDLLKRFFVSAPYVSLVLNLKHHRHTYRTAQKQKAFRFPFPDPKPARLTREKP